MLISYTTSRDFVHLESMRASRQLSDPDHVELYHRAIADGEMR